MKKFEILFALFGAYFFLGISVFGGLMLFHYLYTGGTLVVLLDRVYIGMCIFAAVMTFMHWLTFGSRI